MIKIGDFSKLVGVPVPTLRYYDQVGLLKPIQVDRLTGYRYYAAVQLPRLHRILALKGLSFSLEQQAAQEFVNIAHAPIFGTLGRSLRLMVWNLIRTIQLLMQMLARSLHQMDAAARQQRQTTRERLIDNRNP